MFAVIQTGGKQYLVSPEQELKIEKLPQAKEGKSITFEKVLLTFDLDKEGSVKIGTPFLKGVKVKGEIVETGKGKKVIIFKYRAKQRSHKKQGHRQPFTKVKIIDIQA